MARGLRVPLSQNEELTLRRVALGTALAKDLPAAAVVRLLYLSLIEDRGESFGLTALGKERYERLHETMGGVPDDKAIDGGARSATCEVFDRDRLK